MSHTYPEREFFHVVRRGSLRNPIKEERGNE